MRKCLWSAYKRLERIEVKKLNENTDPVEEIVEDMRMEEYATKLVQEAIELNEFANKLEKLYKKQKNEKEESQLHQVLGCVPSY